MIIIENRYIFVKHDPTGENGSPLRIPDRIVDKHTHNYWCYLPEITDMLNKNCIDALKMEKIACSSVKIIEARIETLLSEPYDDQYENFVCNKVDIELYQQVRNNLREIVDLLGVTNSWLGEKICERGLND